MRARAARPLGTGRGQSWGACQAWRGMVSQPGVVGAQGGTRAGAMAQGDNSEFEFGDLGTFPSCQGAGGRILSGGQA
eukprot:1143400-Prymnesium_polylepis.1